MKSIYTQYIEKKGVMKSFAILLVGGVMFTMVACVNLIKYERSGPLVKPLQTKVKRIIFHEDFIKTEHDLLGLKEPFIVSLTLSLKKMTSFEVIIVKSKEPLPDLRDNKGSLWIIGSIWSQQTKQTGNNVRIKTLSQRTSTYSRSWDVLENISWKKESIMSFTNLYFLEISSYPKMLKSSFTASNIEYISEKGNQGTNQSSVINQVEFSNLDEEAESFFGDSTAKRLTMGYHVVSVPADNKNWKASLEKLAEMAVKLHFQGI